MGSIGTFRKTARNEFIGDIVTLSVQAKGVRIVPTDDRIGENVASHRVMVGQVEIGAAWTKQPDDDREYLSIKLDDPSFTAPILAKLISDGSGQTFQLIWSRTGRHDGD
jgi:uncharacterized protein (DUF736 family)